MQNVPVIYMQSPQGDEIKEVQATTAALTSTDGRKAGIRCPRRRNAGDRPTPKEAK